MFTLTELLNILVCIIKLNLIVVLYFSPLKIEAQVSRSISLDSLQALAKERYPIARQLLLNRQYGYESVKAAGANWLPQLSVGAKSTWQSEVTAVSIPDNLIPGLTLSQGEKRQYQGGLSFAQHS